MSAYATISAMHAAQALGITPYSTDWRDAFLAITESIIGDAETAHFIGPTRTAERWAVTIAGVPVEVLYDPGKAIIFAVERSRQRGGGQTNLLTAAVAGRA